MADFDLAMGEPERQANLRAFDAGDRVHARLYPDYAAGAFAPDAHFVLFFGRVNALVSQESVVLDFGAGRGKLQHIETGWKKELCSLRGRCRRLIGVDVDPVVMENSMTDENYVIDADGRIPLPDDSVDLVMAWAVLEHVTTPETTARELDRVLKPGGWICAWTPNKWGYVGIGARLVPNRLHAPLLRKIGIDRRRDEDVFPVAYKMNTRSVLKRLFPPTRYEHHVALRNGPPGYHGGSLILARLVHLYGAVMPPAGRSMLHAFLRKTR
ncbi:MAG: class I SAM-dependent methyltransferase [Thiohalocapsa sp.]|nr:class I SAM-dependent methyltransferase [Thiohalocapsa sp.]